MTETTLSPTVASNLATLKDRLAAASGPDRLIDSEIEAFLYRSGRNWYGQYEEVPRFTGSDDAAKELAGRILPKAMWRVYDDDDGAVCAAAVTTKSDYYTRKAATWPLAYVLTALEGIPQ